MENENDVIRTIASRKLIHDVMQDDNSNGENYIMQRDGNDVNKL